MRVTRVEEGLWHWTEATDANTANSYLAGSVYYEAPEALVLINPLLPGGDQTARFWDALDDDVTRVDLRVIILLTSAVHARARDQAAISTRYGATTLHAWTTEPASDEPNVAPTEVSPGVELRLCGRSNERIVWLPEPRALVAGDVLRGVDGVTLEWHGRACQDGPTSGDGLRELRQLDPVHVLTCVGPPVMEIGADALERALD